MPYYFLYGEDTYQSWKKLENIKKKYLEAGMGDSNLVTLEAPNFNYDELFRQITAVPFLVKKRLIIIKDLLQSGNTELKSNVVEMVEKIPASAVLIFYERGTSDKRLSLFKKLNKPRQSQEFKFLSEDKIKKWIKEEVEKKGGAINKKISDLLIEYVGNNLWQLGNELDKLISYNSQITEKSVTLLIKPKIETKIFDLTDSILRKNHFSGLKILDNLRQSGENDFYILSMIISQFRSLILVKDQIEKSYKNTRPNQFAISKSIGIHPFAVQKIMQIENKFSFSRIKTIYKQILDFDAKIKTGKLKIDTALELLIIELCGRG